jgi:hypothetical protein
MRRSLIGLLVVVFAATVAATVLGLHALEGSPASPTEEPDAFVSRIVSQIVSDDYATAWTTLYPPHQAVAGSDEYVACEMRSPVGMKLRSISVVRVKDRQLRVPGDSKTSAAKAVTLRLRLANAGAKTVFTHTFNTVAVGSHWTWILTPSRYKLYRSDSCGTT